MGMQLEMNKEMQKKSPNRTEGVLFLQGVSYKDRYRGMISDLLMVGDLLDYEGFESSHRWLIGFEDNKVIVLLEADDYDSFMNIEKIYSVVKRKGYAHKAMREIILSADGWGVDLELDVSPFTYSLIDGEQKTDDIMSVEDLERFYEGYDFEKSELDGIIYFQRLSNKN